MTGRPRLHLANGAFEERAAALHEHGILSVTDLLIVDVVATRWQVTDPDVLLGLAFALRAPRVGHVGVDLRRVREHIDDETVMRVAAADASRILRPLDWPADPNAWEQAVLASALVGPPEERDRPFVRQELASRSTLVMTRRMWREQERLAEAARAMVTSEPALLLAEERVASGVERLFGGSENQGARAVAAAARGRLTVVTGGPGTGKTYSIKRLLALLVEAADDPATPLRVQLAAPTGKAAVRMAEAIAEDLDRLDVEDRVRDALARLQPQTLHKLLGMRPDGSSRHGSDDPIPADLVVVDEASMVDLAMMRRLFESMPAGSRLVLLGDRDQLASVEAGTVLADIVGPVLAGTHEPGAPLAASVVPFTTNYRFKAAPTVAAIAAALSKGSDADLAQARIWMSGDHPVEGDSIPERVRHLGRPREGRPDEAQLDRLAKPYVGAEGYVGRLAAAIREHGSRHSSLRARTFQIELLRALDGYRVLAVHRRGPLGVRGLERALVSRCRGLLEAAARQHAGRADDGPVQFPTQLGHWLGEPILVTENAYDVGLMNGDIGLVLPTEHGLSAIFPSKQDGVETTREVSLARLPECTGAFAMTVHKSQGSQFRHVAVVLAGRDSPIQTRELVYTAITRTSERLDWLGDADELERALGRRVARASGLGDLLWRA